MNMNEQVIAYYDSNVVRKLRDFVEGNERIERAWQKIKQWTPPDVRNILEIGSSIGDISWRMSRQWPQADVLGVDLSGKSVQIAQKLFASHRVSFRKER